MKTKIILVGIFANALLSSATCPYMDGGASIKARSENKLPGDDGFLDQFVVDDKDVYMTSDTGTPVDDRHSLKAGQRGPTLLEDFVVRQKLARFDRERIPERVGTFSTPPSLLYEHCRPPRVLLDSC